MFYDWNAELNRNYDKINVLYHSIHNTIIKI